MTKPEIWKTIGDAFNTRFEDRTPEQIMLTQDGICFALGGLKMHSMTTTVESDVNSSKSYPNNDESDAFFAPIRNARDYSFPDATKEEILEADAFRAKYCYERMNEEK